MTSPSRFRLNDKQAVFEKFDDEILAINLETGTYYSLPGVSAQIWSWLIDGADVQTVKEALITSYDGNAHDIDSAVTHFVDKMRQESLLVPVQTEAAAASIPMAPDTAKKPFTHPVVEMYTDLQDLLLLDPVHDVDDRGWPVFRPGAAATTKN